MFLEESFPWQFFGFEPSLECQEKAFLGLKRVLIDGRNLVETVQSAQVEEEFTDANRQELRVFNLFVDSLLLFKVQLPESVKDLKLSLNVDLLLQSLIFRWFE